MQLEFDWKVDDYEIRAIPKCLVRFEDSDINETIELLKWNYDRNNNKNHCYTLAYWVKDDEGYYLKFVGDRPFEDICPSFLDIVWKGLKEAQKVLNAYWDWDYENKI